MITSTLFFFLATFMSFLHAVSCLPTDFSREPKSLLGRYYVRHPIARVLATPSTPFNVALPDPDSPTVGPIGRVKRFRTTMRKLNNNRGLDVNERNLLDGDSLVSI